MDHEYPLGAIRTLEALEARRGHEVYVVFACGVNYSEMKSFGILGPARLDYGSLVVPASPRNLFPNDLNIGAHYNDHYVFLDKRDAEEYCNSIKNPGDILAQALETKAMTKQYALVLKPTGHTDKKIGDIKDLRSMFYDVNGLALMGLTSAKNIVERLYANDRAVMVLLDPHQMAAMMFYRHTKGALAARGWFIEEITIHTPVEQPEIIHA